MPWTKEGLSTQVAECRRRLGMLLDQKRDVDDSLENAVGKMENQIAEIESNATMISNDNQADAVKKKVDGNSSKMEEYGKRLQKFLTVRDECECDLIESLNRVIRLSPSPSLRSSPIDARTPSDCSLEVMAVTRGEEKSSITATQRNHRLDPSASAATSAFRPLTVSSAAVQKHGLNGRSLLNLAKGFNRDVLGSSANQGLRSVEPPVGNLIDLPREGFTSIAAASTRSSKVNGAASVLLGNSSMDEAASRSLNNLHVDYRNRVVGLGSGNPHDFCQRSADLALSRVTPLPCNVCHVESPSLFWIRLFNHVTNDVEERLNIELEQGKKPIGNPQPGDYCAAFMEDDGDFFYRAKILEIKNNSHGVSFAKILYIDSGKIDWIATKALLELPAKFRQWNRQACPCILSEVIPKSGFWTRDMIQKFIDLCTENGTAKLLVTSLDQGDAPDVNTVAMSRCPRDEPAKLEAFWTLFVAEGMGKLQPTQRMVPMVSFDKEDGEPFGGADPPDVVDGWRCVVRAVSLEQPLAVSTPNPDRPGAASNVATNTSNLMQRTLFENLLL